MKRLALFLPNWIGDVVMATPAIRAVREYFPNAELIAVCKPYVGETLAASPWLDRTIFFGKGCPNEERFWNVARELRRQPIDAAVLFPNSFRAALIAKFGGCARLFGFARYGRDALLSKRLYAERGPQGRFLPMPAIDDYNRIVRLLGVPDPGHRMELFTTDADEHAADASWTRLNLQAFPRVIGLNPGGAFGSSKHWPTNYFAELARMLAAGGYGVIVLCGPSEREIARDIATQAGVAGVVHLADSPLSLGLTKAIVRRLGCLITTDSGPRHFAAAFDRPVVSLFGPTHIGWTETYFSKAVHLQKPVPCGPCQLRVCPLDHRCMTTLTPAEVFEATLKLLQTEDQQDADRHPRIRQAG